MKINEIQFKEMKRIQIEPENWVNHLFGLEEEELVGQLQRGSLKEFLATIPQTIKLGHFSTPSLEELTIQASKTIEKDWPMFEIWNRAPNTWDNSFFDTSALQFKLVSKKPVMFQVASNFDCQEESLKSAFRPSTLYSGFYLTNLMEDLTQGPSAAAGAGAGAVLRWAINYYQPINLLENTILKPVGGKLTKLDCQHEFSIDKLKVGLHAEVEANFDRSSNEGDCFLVKPGRIIDQVFVSTLALKSKEDYPSEVKLFLQTAYQGTYLAAIKQKSRVLVLTLIGGGEFKNPLQSIYEAMAEAHILWARKSSLKKVILPRFNNQSSIKLLISSLIDLGCPKDKIVIKTI